MSEQQPLNHFIVVGGNSWGKAEDVDKAFWNWFKHERPKGDTTLRVRQVNKDAYVDGLGTLYAQPNSVALPDVQVTKAFIKKYEDVMLDLEELLIPVNDAVDFDKM
ncbi:hypothetical protein KEU06_09015 [Pseudaminobacter sp. 19-2017]|uniref:Uncharacterized protein n=1 Tax=Pseudaminobacter soli (ex Zhang et al. 2022) TaxID=2831468 RepID=A0A942I1Y9_9HYPH|nr:hypothetical protein [Pseudaminobacter soli]MBS3648767.1 hypothetical protein [Pseudaminobacter soli]